MRARETASLLLTTLDRDEVVQRFLDMYAAEFRRAGRADAPAHYREQLATIRREAVLVMVLRIEAALPRRLKVRVSVRDARDIASAYRGKRKQRAHRKKTPPRTSLDLSIPLLDLFREEFFVALGQVMAWTDEDTREFWRDLDLYERVTSTESGRRQTPRAKGGLSGPFVDRVGLLLDPSLMEQARRAAGKFQFELQSIADRVLRMVFSRRRSN